MQILLEFLPHPPPFLSWGLGEGNCHHRTFRSASMLSGRPEKVSPLPSQKFLQLRTFNMRSVIFGVQLLSWVIITWPQIVSNMGLVSCLLDERNVLAAKPDNLSVSPGHMCWKERTMSLKLSSDLYICAIVKEELSQVGPATLLIHAPLINPP